DPCLADLPHVVNACCGHGSTFAYATLSNGFCLTSKALKIYLQKVGRLKQFQKLAGERGWYFREEVFRPTKEKPRLRCKQTGPESVAMKPNHTTPPRRRPRSRHARRFSAA